MKRLISFFAALVIISCFIIACGQKGLLYMPNDSRGSHNQAQTLQSQTHNNNTDSTKEIYGCF
ncbi:LPS translocon maturation chaperone LptM [Candidatus Pseudomonas adelgestsugas]